MTNAQALRGAALLLAAGCVTDDGLGPDLRAPQILSSVAAANPNNVLSAVVAVRTRFVDSVAVRYGPAGATLKSVTPSVKPLGLGGTLPSDLTLLPVLGLVPETEYQLQVVAYRGRYLAAGESLELTTGSLPADLPSYIASGPDPLPGYIAFAAGKYGLVIDNTGRVVWYHRFADGPGLNFMAQPTGHFVARPTTPELTDLDPWVEIDVLGNVIRTFGCAQGLTPRFHDLIGESDGAYWIMCDETRVMDLSGAGGVANAQVTGTVIQHVSADGTLLFQWSPFDHFQITDLDSASRVGSRVNWTHGNSLDLGSDGNLVVSFRSLSEITKIDTQTGAIVWRMGGLRNQFVFQDVPAQAFFRQHGVRMAGAGRLLLLDNLGDPTGSRGERYAFDPASRTARLLGSYVPSAPVTALLGGTTQDLPDGHTLVSFGTAGRVEEYDAAGRMVWQIEGNAGYVFRAQRIRSLYTPGVGGPR